MFIVDEQTSLLLVVQAVIELLVCLSAKSSLGDCVTVKWEHTILKTILSSEIEGMQNLYAF